MMTTEETQSPKPVSHRHHPRVIAAMDACERSSVGERAGWGWDKDSRICVFLWRATLATRKEQFDTGASWLIESLIGAFEPYTISLPTHHTVEYIQKIEQDRHGPAT